MIQTSIEEIHAYQIDFLWVLSPLLVLDSTYLEYLSKQEFRSDFTTDCGPFWRVKFGFLQYWFYSNQQFPST